MGSDVQRGAGVCLHRAAFYSCSYSSSYSCSVFEVRNEYFCSLQRLSERIREIMATRWTIPGTRLRIWVRSEFYADSESGVKRVPARVRSWPTCVILPRLFRAKPRLLAPNYGPPPRCKLCFDVIYLRSAITKRLMNYLQKYILGRSLLKKKKFENILEQFWKLYNLDV